MSTEPGLADLQSWLQAVSTHPGGLPAGIREAQQGVGLGDEQLDEVVQTGFGIGSRKRLGIYHHGYFARLLQCLRAEYEVLCKAFSREWFDAMGIRYLAHCPSNSWTLADLGAGFPDFLEADRPDGDEAPSGREPAFDFIVELARLERTLVEISRGPGIEGTDRCVPGGLETHGPDDIRIVVSPSLRLLHTTFSLREYFEAAREGNAPGVPDAQPQWLALCRLDYQVFLHEVPPWQFDLLLRLTEDGRLGPALAFAGDLHPEEPVEARWRAAVELFWKRGIVAAVET